MKINYVDILVGDHLELIHRMLTDAKIEILEKGLIRFRHDPM